MKRRWKLAFLLAMTAGIAAVVGMGFAPVARSGSATFGPFALTVQVNEAVCASVPVQCSQTGHSTVAAASTNHNPVMIVMQVLQGGNPVNNLPSGAFTVDTLFVPAGGSEVQRLACTDCFQHQRAGVYAIYVHPDAPGDASTPWLRGSYFMQVRVAVPTPNGTVTRRALTQIEIVS